MLTVFTELEKLLHFVAIIILHFIAQACKIRNGEAIIGEK